MANKPTVIVTQGSVDEQALRKQYGDTIDYKYGNNQFVGADRAATNTMYAQYLGNLGVGRQNTDVDLNSLTSQPVQQQVVSQPSRYDSTQATADIQSSLRQNSDSYMTNQKAQLDAALSTQIKMLQSAYEKAISDGQISVRDAQDNFVKQKASLEQQAYVNAERTALISQDMGIQNSQQSLGLIQGDQARSATLKNANMTERDKAIFDIQTRLKSLGTQTALSVTDAQAQHDYGLVAAQATADQQYAQGMLGIQSDALNANRNQQFALDNMSTANDYQLGQLATNQVYQQENMKTAQEFAVENMYTGHKLDLEKLDVQFERDVKMAEIQFGYSSSLQGSAHANAMAQAKANMRDAVAEEQAKYDLFNSRLVKQGMVDDNGKPLTVEAEIYQQQAKQAMDKSVSEIYTKSIAEITVEKMKKTLIEPTKSFFDWSGTVYDKEMEAYNAEKKAQDAWLKKYGQ